MAKTTEKDIGIEVRRIQFGHENLADRYYFDGNPFMTHMLNGLHSVFPAGERLFIRSIKYFEKQVQDPELKARVKAFIGQEMQHGIQHEKFLKTLDAMGLNASEWTEWYANNAYQTPDSHETRWMALVERLFDRKTAETFSLSITAALEHYTASIAEFLFKHPELVEQLPEDMKKFLMWHAAEEIEHKSVAYDVFKDVAQGSYPMRLAGLAGGTFYLLYYAGLGWAHYLLADKEMNRVELLPAMAKSSPLYWKLVLEMAVLIAPYFKPDFHPNDSDNDRYAKEFFAEAAKYIEAKSA